MNPVCDGGCVPSPIHGFYTCSCEGGLKLNRNSVDCIGEDGLSSLQCREIIMKISSCKTNLWPFWDFIFSQ